MSNENFKIGKKEEKEDKGFDGFEMTSIDIDNNVKKKGQKSPEIRI